MRVRAPDFRPELDWINTGGRRYSLADFRGRVLVLDFWTYGCINCIHMIPELREIERRFPNEVAVVGVHSAKFPNERSTHNIARACERLGVTHPVINDRQLRIWREYAINAWPTLIVISPQSYVVAMHRGEITAEEMAPTLEQIIDEARAAGQLQPQAAPTQSSATLPPEPSMLRFPAKLQAADQDRLFVADTGHHRVLEIALNATRSAGRVVRVFGCGNPGWQDGSAEDARFRAPHGLTVANDTVYVADTENHLLRAIDLEAGRVSTLAGTGAQAQPFSSDGSARDTALNSPWDVLWMDEALYVAMAGCHQLWRLDLDRSWAQAYVGSGAERLHDAPLPEAALAQPSGLASDGTRLYFTDPEASAIRSAHSEEGVRTLVGTGLFDSGDRDGTGDEARLQHALGIAAWPEQSKFLIADTYNHRIKLLDPATRGVTAYVGSGEPGYQDGSANDAAFWEPGGVSVSPDGRHAFVADTNNHRIRVIDLATHAVATLSLEDANDG